MSVENAVLVSQQRVCRCCMVSEDSNPDLSTKEQIGLHLIDDQIKEKLIFCTRLEIDKNDELPFNICLECTNNIIFCFDFINTCIKTDQLLKSDSPLKFIKKSTANGSQISIKEEEYSEDDCDNDVLCESIDVKLENTIGNKNNQDNYMNDSEIKIVSLKKKKVKNKLDEPLNMKIKSKKNYTCSICNEKFMNKKSLMLHFVEKHENKRFVCNYCSKGFTRSQTLLQHLATHTDVKPYACNMCPKSYKQHSQLAIHRRSHSKERPYKCEKCDMSFKSKTAVVNHKKHHEEDTHLCELCGQKFTQLGNLKVHMRIHTGEKPYACMVCPFKCSVQSGMRRHERIHSNIKKYICPMCHKSFLTSGVLIRHIRIHTGELPYKCSYCSKAFIDNWKRKKHLNKVHNISLSDIPPTTSGRKRIYTKKIEDEESSDMKSENDVKKLN